MNQKAPADFLCTYIHSDGHKCPEPYKAGGYCAGHYRRAKLGQDMDPPIRSFRVADTEFRFWRFIERQEGGCWLWTGCRDAQPFDYGQFYDGHVKRARRAHVVMWELTHGKSVPNGKCVRHTCDNPPCVRPEHLELGDAGDNVQDQIDRDRIARGSARNQSGLTDEMVVAIRADHAKGALQRDLAVRYGVGQQSISNIITRKTWTHIP